MNTYGDRATSPVPMPPPNFVTCSMKMWGVSCHITDTLHEHVLYTSYSETSLMPPHPLAVAYLSTCCSNSTTLHLTTTALPYIATVDLVKYFREGFLP